MRMRRLFRSLSAFLTQLGAAMLKAIVTSAVLGVVLVSVMQYMGVPVPSAHDLIGGLTRLAHVLS
jgi:phosphate/sulfate permease